MLLLSVTVVLGSMQLVDCKIDESILGGGGVAVAVVVVVAVVAVVGGGGVAVVAVD